MWYRMSPLPGVTSSCEHGVRFYGEPVRCIRIGVDLELWRSIGGDGCPVLKTEDTQDRLILDPCTATLRRGVVQSRSRQQTPLYCLL